MTGPYDLTWAEYGIVFACSIVLIVGVTAIQIIRNKRTP